MNTKQRRRSNADNKNKQQALHAAEFLQLKKEAIRILL
jgi:hypothetical protein